MTQTPTLAQALEWWDQNFGAFEGSGQPEVRVLAETARLLANDAEMILLSGQPDSQGWRTSFRASVAEIRAALERNRANPV